MRTFIHYDEDGEVVAVVQTESLPEGVEHPFYIEDERHGVLEVTGGEEKAGWHTGGDIGRDFKVNVAKQKLIGKSAPKRATGEATRQEATTEALATEAPEPEATKTKAATTRSATKPTAKKPETKPTTKKPETKKSATKKPTTKKSATKKTATKKGKRPSGSK